MFTVLVNGLGTQGPTDKTLPTGRRRNVLSCQLQSAKTLRVHPIAAPQRCHPVLSILFILYAFLDSSVSTFHKYGMKYPFLR